MGICASCLGLDRHPSQDVRAPSFVRPTCLHRLTLVQIDETDALLEEENVGYGAVGGDGQADEEDVRREREELDRITNAATE